ncbi:condensation domain-containing protein, partial [Methylolobus aquaticus]
WARHLEIYAASAALRQEAAFWGAMLREGAPSLPQDFPGPPGCSVDARSVTVTIDREATGRLLRDANAAYRTRIDELLLTALARALRVWSGHDTLLVELEGHGRTDRFEGLDLSRTVGWFTAAFPVRLSPADDVAVSIKVIKEQLRRIPDDGVGYGVLRRLGDAGTREALGGLPSPQVAFNYLGQFGTEREDAELFRPASEARGAEMAESAPLALGIEVNGQVYAGELAFNWLYSGAQYRPETIERLAASFRAELLAVITHCVSGASGLTPSDVPWTGLDQSRLDGLPASAIEAIYPLTPLQRGLLFHAVYEPGADAYVTQFDVAVGGLDVERFAAAWRWALARHGALRTAFLWQPEPAVQIVFRAVELPLEQLDWRDAEVTPGRLEALCAAEHARALDLGRPPLFRLTLVALPGGGHHLIWTCHHLLLDGWSSARLLAEVLQHYHGATPVPPTGNYRDYVAWVTTRDPAASEAFWKTQIAPLEAPTRLAEVVPVTLPQSGHGLRRTSLSPADTERLRVFAQRHAITLSTLVQGAWALLLRIYTGQTSVVFGATVAGRPAELPAAEELVGLFINSVPVVVEFPRHQTLIDWLASLQQRSLDRDQHAHTPLYEIQRWAGSAGEALFDTLLVFENYPVDRVLVNRDGLGLHFGAARHAETTNYPLTLAVQSGETLEVLYDFARDSFDESTVERLKDQLEHLLDALVSDSSRRLGTVDLLVDAEWSALTEWNRGAWEGLGEGTSSVSEQIARWAAGQPDAVAVVAGE